MRLLLDTSIWLWSLLEPRHLAKEVVAELDNPSNELWLSPISIWELMILAHKRRITLYPDPISFVRDSLKKSPYHEAPINHEVAIQSRLLDLLHEDPADRFLAATALVYDLTLVTADERLLGLKNIPALANR